MRERGIKLYEEVMAENVHNLKKETHSQVQEAQSFKLNEKRTTPNTL